MTAMKALTFLALLILQLPLVAQSIWNGAGTDNKWSTGANWGSTAPVSTDSLHFGGSTQLAPVNDYALGTMFTQIRFLAGAGSFDLQGNRIRTTGIVNASSNLQRVSLDVQIPVNVTLNGGASGLHLAGAISQQGCFVDSTHRVWSS